MNKIQPNKFTRDILNKNKIKKDYSVVIGFLTTLVLAAAGMVLFMFAWNYGFGKMGLPKINFLQTVAVSWCLFHIGKVIGIRKS